MKVGFATNAWGEVLALSDATTNVNDAYYLSTGSDQEAIAIIGQAGFEYVELLDGNLLRFEADEDGFRKLLQKNNVKLLTVYCAANFIYDEILDEELFKIERALKFAAKLGAKFLVLGGGARRCNGVRDTDYIKLGDALDKAAALADKYGIHAGYHPHLGALVLTESEIDKLMAATHIDLVPDFGHICAGGGDPVAIVSKYAERICYVHLADHDGNDFRLFGEGNVDFKEIVRILSQNGRTVTYAIEAAYQVDRYYAGNHHSMLELAARNVNRILGV